MSETLSAASSVARGTPGQLAARRPARRRRWAPFLFLVPALVLHASVVAIPSILTLGASLFQWDGLSDPSFIGLENFRRILSEDQIFKTAFTNNLKWTLLFLTVPVVLGLGSALLITGIKRGQLFFRTIFYLPATVASIVVGRIWQWIYNPFFGLNTVLVSAGLGAFALNWLSDPSLSLYSVAFADNWRWWGFLSIVFLTALTQIDPTLYESAALDGANTWQRIWYITLPLLRPTLVFVGLTTILGSFQTFDMIYILTQGGPGNASQMVSTYIYFQFINMFSSGYASAIAVMVTLILSIIIVSYIYLRQRGWEI
jgi:raffinose/stachyose/melibiose transport system permease protein